MEENLKTWQVFLEFGQWNFLRMKRYIMWNNQIKNNIEKVNAVYSNVIIFSNVCNKRADINRTKQNKVKICLKPCKTFHALGYWKTRNISS